MSQLVSLGACRRWSRTFFSSLSRRRLLDLGIVLALSRLCRRVVCWPQGDVPKLGAFAMQLTDLSVLDRPRAD